MKIRIKPNGLVANDDGRMLAEVELVDEAGPEFVGNLPRTADGCSFGTGVRLHLLRWCPVQGSWRVEGVEVETIKQRRTGCLAPRYPEGEEYFVSVAMDPYRAVVDKIHERELWRDVDRAVEMATNLNVARCKPQGVAGE